MVKRYQTFRERQKVLKDIPFYRRNIRQTQIVCWVVPLMFMFVPPIYQFLFPKSAEELNPRTEGEVRDLKKKFKQRERSFLDNSWITPPEVTND